MLTERERKKLPKLYRAHGLTHYSPLWDSMTDIESDVMACTIGGGVDVVQVVAGDGLAPSAPHN
jgi:hypothetical protein